MAKKLKWYKRASVQTAAKWIAGILTTVLVTFIGAYISGIFEPKTLRVALTQLTAETNVSLEEFLKRSKFPSDEYTTEDLQENGYAIHFQVQIEGFKGRKCAARWTVYDAESKSSLEIPAFWTDLQSPIDFTPEQTIDQAGDNFWVPPLDTNRSFFVRVQIYDDKDVLLTFADSDPIKPNPPVAH